MSRSRAVAPGQGLEADVVIPGVANERDNLVLRVPRDFTYIVLACENAAAITLLETAADDAAPARHFDHGLGAAGDLRPIGQRERGDLDDRRARRVGGFVGHEQIEQQQAGPIRCARTRSSASSAATRPVSDWNAPPAMNAAP